VFLFGVSMVLRDAIGTTGIMQQVTIESMKKLIG
jgi:hypothetical protein